MPRGWMSAGLAISIRGECEKSVTAGGMKNGPRGEWRVSSAGKEWRVSSAGDVG